jgi:cytochrome c-type protein NapB
MTEEIETEEAQRRLLNMFLIGVLCITFIGFFVGTKYTEEAEVVETASAKPTERLQEPAPTSAWLQETAGGVIGVAPESALPNGRVKSREIRWGNRAYSGAPPTIPHSVNQRGPVACLACHEKGLQVRDKFASLISHEKLTQCTQCHVVAKAPMPNAVLPHSSGIELNLFKPFRITGGGPRAWDKAPPQIPHHTQMRGACLSCHGKRGAIPTSHPERVSCTQCHAPTGASK